MSFLQIVSELKLRKIKTDFREIDQQLHADSDYSFHYQSTKDFEAELFFVDFSTA